MRHRTTISVILFADYVTSFGNSQVVIFTISAKTIPLFFTDIALKINSNAKWLLALVSCYKCKYSAEVALGRNYPGDNALDTLKFCFTQIAKSLYFAFSERRKKYF